MKRRANEPTPLGDALARYLDDAGLQDRVDEAGILPAWAERVGDAIAAVTQPLRTSRGTLLVAVRSSAWLMELRLMEREILRCLNAGRERGRIQRVRFVMADSPEARAEPAGEDTPPGPGAHPP